MIECKTKKLFIHAFHSQGAQKNFLMAPLLNKVWNTKVAEKDTSISLTLSSNSKIAVVAINQAHGIGSVFDATEFGVECYLGSRGSGVEEALARALIPITGCTRVLLTLAVYERDSATVRQLLDEIKEVSRELLV